jgi:signal transduction histidine kinase
LTRCRALIAELKSRTHDGPNDEKDTIGNNEQFETLLRMAEMLLLTGEQAEEAIQSMKRYMEHIVNIIHMQQDFSRTSEIVDMHRLDHLVEQAVEICCTANPKVAPVRILRDFGSVPEIPIDRHKFLQILVNLLGNAIWAVQESGGQGSVTVRTDTNETGHVCVEVLDDGIGIPSENIPRIFSQGFTTRCDGHGYGLHSAANMAWEMGGKLQAFSDGPGKGARFLLELPIRQ